MRRLAVATSVCVEIAPPPPAGENLKESRRTKSGDVVVRGNVAMATSSWNRRRQ